MRHLLASEIRAARALVGWSQSDLAEATRLGLRTIKRAEAEEMLTAAADFAIRSALEAAGVVFVISGNDLAGKEIVAGVALIRKPQ